MVNKLNTKHTMKFLFVTLLAGMGVYCYFRFSSFGLKSEENRIRETKKAGNVIKDALEDYANKYNNYPEKLDALVPEFMSSIENPVWGERKWHYQAGADNYELSVSKNKNRYPILFTSSDANWYLDN